MTRYRKFTTICCAAVFALGLAACGGGGGSPQATVPPGPTLEERQDTQRTAITNAIAAAQTAVAAVMNDSTDAQVSAAGTAVMNARSAISAAADVPAGEKAAFGGTVDALDARLTAATAARMAYMDEADRTAAAAMAVTAAKLYAGISVPNSTDGADKRHAAYSGDSDSQIAVEIGTVTVDLSEDKKATVAAHHGWQGKKFAASGTSGTYEAVVYSNVGMPTQGKKFGSPVVSGDYQYTLDAGSNTELTIDDTNAGTGWAARVASPSFDHPAGSKTFELPDNTVRVMIAGSYHGVSGTYYCTPATASTCAARVAADGFELGGTADADNAFTVGGGTWTFKASSNEARVTSMPDANYASYGWWIHKSADGTFTASAFTDNKGTDPETLGIASLRGTATYMGGAAGKYALYNSGVGDAGHFTARAMLSATFAEEHKISGTIDNFMGADGMSRDWSVKLNETDISDTGVIDGVGGNNNDVEVGTVWTIGGTAAAKSGQWRGNLQEAGDDGVPSVARGTFYSEYSTSGKIVGGFGAKRQ